MDNQGRTYESGARLFLTAFGIALAPLLETVDSSIVNVALPDIQGNLGASLDEVTFVVTGYLTANVIVIPLTPWFAERFGRQRYLTASIIGFTIVSMLCGLAPNVTSLVLLRVLQGFFGGGLLATTQAVLRDLFPPDQAATGQAIFGVTIATGPILGPLLGGIIVDQASWPWIFFVNVIPGSICAFAAGRLLRVRYAPRRTAVEGIGIGWLVLGIGPLQFLLDEGERNDWFGSELIVVCAIASCVGLGAFVAHSLRVNRPIVDLRALADRSIWAGCLLAFGFGVTLIGYNIILPQFLQNSLQFTPALSGQYLLFRGVPVVTLAPLIGAALGANRFDPRILIAIGFLAIGLGTGWIGNLTTSESDFGVLVWPLVLTGVGTAFLIIPLLTIVISGVSAANAPKASAFVTLSTQLGGSVSSALVIALFDRRQRFHSSVLAGTATAQHVHRIGAFGTSTLAAIIQGQAAVLAYADVAYLIAVVAFALVPCCFLVRRPPIGVRLESATE